MERLPLKTSERRSLFASSCSSIFVASHGFKHQGVDAGDFDGISHLLDVAVKAALTERTHGYEHFGTRVHSFMEAILADLIRQFGIIGLYAAAGAAAAGVGAVMRHFTELKPGNSPEYGPRLLNEALSPAHMAGIVVGHDLMNGL